MDKFKQKVRQLRRILDRFARAEKLAGDDAEPEFDSAAAEVRSLDRERIIEALDQAIGRSKPRKKASVYVLAELTDIPEAVERIKQELSNPDWRIRHTVLGTIWLHRLTSLAPLLNKIMLEDPDEMCRRSAIGSAGTFRLDVNFPTIMKLVETMICTEDNDAGLEMSIICALMDYGREEGRAYLLRVFQRPVGPTPSDEERADVNNPIAIRKEFEWSSKKSAKVHAAWGLAKLGDLTAIEYLGDMLYDPIFECPQKYDSGQRLRSAQALADVFGLPFEWHIDNVRSIQNWWEENREKVINELPRPPGASSE